MAAAGCLAVHAPQTPPPAPPATPPAPQPPPDPPPPQAAPAPIKPSTTVVIEGPEASQQPTSVVEAAKAERERRKKMGKPGIVLDNKSLPRYATGSLTTAVPTTKPTQVSSPGDGRDEPYWRRRARETRQRWRDSFERIGALQAEVDSWRQKFYSEDDPYVRDGQIKPAWDHALEQLAQARKDDETAKNDLTALLEEGRRADALPGWLREGIEIEPADGGPQATTKSAEPGEPQVRDEQDARPPR